QHPAGRSAPAAVLLLPDPDLRTLDQAACSLAIATASHLTPWRPKFTCTRASPPSPSASTITPAPNLGWVTFWPMRKPTASALLSLKNRSCFGAAEGKVGEWNSFRLANRG